jgi:ectoine hydroxylase-related dioxygenase (phytanoyl-CoA dioxygenase family)
MELKEAKRQLDEQGYCILEDQLDPDEASHLDAQARSLMEHQKEHIWGANGYLSLEGALNPMPELAPLCTHPTILELVEMVLGENFILANNVAMKWCKPGAEPGGLHSAWAAKERSHAFVDYSIDLQVFWMLTDFTAKNGATMVVPFSHHSRRTPTQERYPQEIPVVGKKGSVFAFYDTLWHRSGANTSHDQHRMAANILYLPWYIYIQTGQWPPLKRALYNQFSPRLQELLARSVEK